MSYSTTAELAKSYRKQIDCKFAKTSAQVSTDTRVGRKLLLSHLSKLSRQVQGNSRLALKVEGRI